MSLLNRNSKTEVRVDSKKKTIDVTPGDRYDLAIAVQDIVPTPEDLLQFPSYGITRARISVQVDYFVEGESV